MRVDGFGGGIALTYRSLLSVAIILRFNGDTLYIILVLSLWHVDPCFCLISISLPSFKILCILFLELGFPSRHGSSFLIWDITPTGHWDTFFSFSSFVSFLSVGIRCGLDHNSLDLDSLPTSPLVT